MTGQEPCHHLTFRFSLQLKFFGDFSEGVTPVPIPNTVVKPLSADGTALVTVWESRSLPRLKTNGLSFLSPFCYRFLSNPLFISSAINRLKKMRKFL